MQDAIPTSRPFLLLRTAVLAVVPLMVVAACASKAVNEAVDIDDARARRVRVEQVAEWVSLCVIETPRESEREVRGAIQEIKLDLARLKSSCPECEVEINGPLVTIKRMGLAYRLQLRWVGKGCSFQRDGLIVTLSFANWFVGQQKGHYLYTIYDNNGLVWHTYLMAKNGSAHGIPIDLSYEGKLGPAEDEAKLAKYEFYFVSGETGCPH